MGRVSYVRRCRVAYAKRRSPAALAIIDTEWGGKAQGSIGVAVFETGAMSGLHASLLSRDARVTIRGFADVSEGKARTAVQTYGGNPSSTTEA